MSRRRARRCSVPHRRRNGSASPSPSGTPSAQPSPSASPLNQPSGSASPSASASVTRSESSTGTASGSPSASVKNCADVIEGNNPTNAQLKACGAARAEVQMATVALQQTVKQLTTQRVRVRRTVRVGAAVRRPARAAPAPPRRSARPRWPRRRRSCCRPNRTCSRHRTVRPRAELVAPISGMIGSVDLKAGDSASSGSITIVGSGNAQVQVELPLKTRTLDRDRTAGERLPRRVSHHAARHGDGDQCARDQRHRRRHPDLHHHGVSVADSNQLLASGARASVTIPVRTATGVLRVPASALTRPERNRHRAGGRQCAGRDRL